MAFAADLPLKEFSTMPGQDARHRIAWFAVLTTMAATDLLAGQQAAGAASQAPAQNAGQSDPTAIAAPERSTGAKPSVGTAGSKLEEVVVTAQRRTQRLQDVPVSVTVLSGKELSRQQVTDTDELIRLVPNFSGGNNVGFASANVYYIRGLGQTESFTTFEPQVGTYVNDIYISRQNDNNFALFDVQDIQVLRGPQGTLFGRNSTGGAIVVTLNPPKDSFGGYLELGGGDRSRFESRGSVDLPVSDEILTKTSVFGITDNGYGKDLTTGQTLNDHHDVGVREAIRLIPKSSDIVWDLAADYADNKGANVLNFPDSSGPRIGYSGFSNDGNLDGLISGEKANLGQGAEVMSFGGSSDLAVHLDAGTLHVISGYRGLKQASSIDFPDAQFGPLVPDDQDKIGQFALASIVLGDEYTQEVKWNGQLGSRLTYTGGLYYLYETDQTNFGAAGYLPAAIPFPVAFGDETFRNTTSSAAAYGQVDYKILDALTATVGLRYTLERKTLQISPNRPAVPGLANIIEAPFDTQDVRRAGYETTLNSDVLTPRFALQYRIDPSLMVYGSATKGFQGGGWNSLAFSAATFNNFGPEKVWSYESGSRYEAPGGTFRAGASLFLEEVSHYQLLSTSPSPGNFVTQNAANLEAYGFEGDASWIPLTDLTLSTSLGLQKGSYNSPSANVFAQEQGCITGRHTGSAALIAGNCQSGIVNATGSLAGPSDLPAFTLSLTGTYVWHLPSFSLTPTVGVQAVGRQNNDPSDTPAGVDPAYATVDAGVTFHLDRAPWTFTAECRNCTFTDYGVSYLFGHKYYNDPGLWDVRLNYKF